HITHGKRLGDIDTIDDVKEYAPHLLPKLPLISIIIPVYYEDEMLIHTIDTLRDNATHNDFEIIIIDTHALTTINRLPIEDVRTGVASKGRASQMNEGARMAQSNILVFLHADTMLPKAWDTLIEEALHKHQAGAFSLGINDTRYVFRFIETLANIRTKITRIPYGDQAHFFTASFFRELESYMEIPLMEDVEIMSRIKKQGKQIALLKPKVLTSSRRWEKEGIVYTTLRNRFLSFLYTCGVSSKHLVKCYKTHR
ncbi:MAG: TIGR04283 family arsenosugar biosynthesis glycosyltransferase, partial [Sulfurospirillaceae bacterium]|nr:TIGR04283 family arsenosugar biosynthesis glycosyltransferase [Sulfurospirillaceae bacterium]